MIARYATKTVKMMCTVQNTKVERCSPSCIFPILSTSMHQTAESVVLHETRGRTVPSSP